MTEISYFSFDVPTLQSLEGVFDHHVDLGFSDVHGLGFNVSVLPKLEATGLAFGNVVVGRVVGKFQGSGRSATIHTLECDV